MVTPGTTGRGETVSGQLFDPNSWDTQTFIIQAGAVGFYTAVLYIITFTPLSKNSTRRFHRVTTEIH